MQISRGTGQRISGHSWLVFFAVFALLVAVASGLFIYLRSNTSKMETVAPRINTDTVGVSDGYVPNDKPLRSFDADVPALSKLNPQLLDAIQRAARDAAADGVEMYMTAGWRSVAYQQQLLDEAVVTYGSLKEARRYVSTPEDSRHVSGDAVDIGPTDASSWLSQYGNAYGLCQTYANEMWHYELVIEPGEICPEQKIDASGS